MKIEAIWVQEGFPGRTERLTNLKPGSETINYNLRPGKELDNRVTLFQLVEMLWLSGPIIYVHYACLPGYSL